MDDEDQQCPHCGAPGSHRLLALANENERLRSERELLRAAIALHREQRGTPRTSNGDPSGFPCDHELWAVLEPS